MKQTIYIYIYIRVIISSSRDQSIGRFIKKDCYPERSSFLNSYITKGLFSSIFFLYERDKIGRRVGFWTYESPRRDSEPRGRSPLSRIAERASLPERGPVLFSTVSDLFIARSFRPLLPSLFSPRAADESANVPFSSSHNYADSWPIR